VRRGSDGFLREQERCGGLPGPQYKAGAKRRYAARYADGDKVEGERDGVVEFSQRKRVHGADSRAFHINVNFFRYMRTEIRIARVAMEADRLVHHEVVIVFGFTLTLLFVFTAAILIAEGRHPPPPG